MKKICALIVFAFFHFLNVQGQHIGDYRSKTGRNLSWNDSTAWETYNGIVWTRASKGMLPSLTSEVEIIAGDTMAVNDSSSASANLKVDGVLKFGKTKNCQIKVYGNVIIGKTGTITSPMSGSVFTHLLLNGGKVYTTSATDGIIAGMYAIGPKTSYAGYAGSFTKLTDALNAISSLPLPGNLIFEFQPDYKPSVEKYPISLNSNIYSSETSTVTFRPASTVNAVINFSNSGTVLNNTGADYIIFDGRNGGIGTNHYLQFENTSNYYSTISFSNDVLQNKFLYCILTGSTKVTDTGILTLNSPKTGNNYNTVDHCEFNGNGSANNCIYTVGLSSDLTITNSNFFDFRMGAGINIPDGCNNVIIDNNNFYQTKLYTGLEGSTSGIIINGGANCRISNNNIGGNSPGLNGTWTVSDISTCNYYFTGISATLLSTTSKIYNNRIQNINWKTNLSNWTGINVSGVVKVGSDGANYIGNNTGNDNIVIKYYSSNSSKVCGIITDGAAIIENNIIGSFTTSFNGQVRISINFTGIYSTGTGIINKNTIGSSTISNSVNISPQSYSGSIQNVYGIYSSGSPIVISNNLIANVSNGSVLSSGVTSGILISNSDYATTLTVTSNTIHSISSSQPTTTSGNSASLHGINIQSNNDSKTIVTITGNSIYDLINLNSSGICINGILFNSSFTIGNKVDKNLIHSFKSPSNTAIQNGINITGGAATFQNNVIRLGIDVKGNSITNTVQINGIAKVSTGTNYFYFNTVFIGGSNVMAGSVKTYAMNFSMKSDQDEYMKNNILINMRTNIIPNKLNYAALEPAFGVDNWYSDYNIYYVTSTDGKLSVINGVEALTLKDLQIAYPGGDLHSGFGDPLLSHPSDEMGSMDLRPNDLSPAESTGLEIVGITDDITGALRSLNTPTDIGAYSGNMIRNNSTQDIFCPAIQFNKLGYASSLTNRLTKNFAFITDNVGRININTGTKPRLYYKLSTNDDAFVGNTASDNGWKWVEATGVTSPFDFNIDYSLLFGGPVKLNYSSIQYFVVAQNLLTIPNVTFYPTKGAAGVSVSPEGMKAPLDPFFYYIVPLVPTTMNVGIGQTYSTLTGPGGVFDVINTGSINDNILVTIKSDLNEPGNKILKHINEDGPNAGTLTLTIQSDGSSHIISGSNVNSTIPLISLSGVERFKIDGGDNKLLTFRNTNTNSANAKPVFQFDNSCQNGYLTNCNIESNLTATTSGAILIGLTGHNNITISQNDIRNSRGGTAGSPLVGIYSSSAGNTLNIINNNIYNLKNANSYGIYLNEVSNGCTIKGNSIYMEPGISALGSFTGIWVGYSNNHIVDGNFIGGSAPKCGGNDPFTISGSGTFTGINTYKTSIPEVLLQGNTIQNIKMTDSTTPVFYGINNYYGTVTISSNTIGSNSDPNSVQIAGNGISSGILQSYAGAVYSGTIEKNTIANISLTNSTGSPTFCALNMTGGTVRMNSIFNIGSPVQSLTPVIYGIKNSVGGASNEFSNNAISLNGGDATSSVLYGYYDCSSSGSTGFYYNSINITGSAARDSSTYAYYSTSNTPRVLKNNILVNTRTGGTGKHYALYSSVITGLSSDFNDLYCTGPTLGHYGPGGTANDISDLSTWKTGTNQDANSIGNDPLFNSLTCLIPDKSSPVNGSGTPLASVNTDIKGKNRNAIATTLGAYELDCTEVTYGGIIKGDQLININTLPDKIMSITPASGFFGQLNYKWQSSVSPFTIWNDIETSNASTYQPGLVTETTQYKRLALTTCMTDWSESAASNVVTLTLNLNKWIGTSDTNWNNPGNWSLNKVPDENDNIVFGDHPAHDCFLDHNRTVNDLSNHQSDYKLNINGKTLTIKGNLNFTNGALLISDSLNSTLVFSGSAFQTIPSNVLNNKNVYNLTIDNAAGVSPDSDFTVSNLLTINAGKQFIIPTDRLIDIKGSINNYAGTSGLILKTSPTGELPNGSIIFHNDTATLSRVPATVEMYSKACRVDGLYKWQFFGIPLKSIQSYPIFNGSYVREMHEEIDGKGHWEQLQNESVLSSFKGYEITQETAKTISFEGYLENADFGPVQLSYTSDVTYKGQHLIGNPYTAAINITNEENPSNSLIFGNGMYKTIFLYNTGSKDDWSKNGLNGGGNNDSPGQYLSVPQDYAGSDILPASIPSMQAFLVMVKTPGPDATIAIPYSSTGTVTKNTLLQRVKPSEKIFTRIDLSGESSGDRMWIFTNPDCTRGFDNGRDGYKLMGSNNSPQLYASEADGDYQVNSIDDINNSCIGFKAGIDTSYSLTFTHHNKDPRYKHLYLTDLVQNKTVDITASGSEYDFQSGSGIQIEKRFKIIAVHEDTDIYTNTKSFETIPQPISVFNSGNIIVIKNQTGLNGFLFLFDITGRLIEKFTFVANGITTLTIQLPTGSYLVNAVTPAYQLSTLLIIQDIK